jgi:hypothetical protein
MIINFRLSYNICGKKKSWFHKIFDMKDIAFFIDFCYHEKSTKFSYGVQMV